MNATLEPNREAQHAQDLFDQLDGQGAILDQRDLEIIQASFERHMKEVQAAMLASFRPAMQSRFIWN